MVQNSWVVVHGGYRDAYQLPMAFAETNSLASFVTDWYTPLDSPIWRTAKDMSAAMPLGLSKRFHSGLPSALVSDGKAAFLARYVMRKFSGASLRDDIEGVHLGKAAAREARRHKANLLAASYCAASAFQNAPGHCRKVLFQVHPHPRFLRRLYTSTMNTHPTYSGLAQEPEMLATEDELKDWEKESALADTVICASRFTARSLVESGVAPERISIVPYGVDTNVFESGEPDSTQPFTALFVGQAVARKSIGLLLTAWQHLHRPDARLVIVSGHVRDGQLLDSFHGIYEEVARAGQGQLVDLYRNADLFVLPSVAEGFGHVYLEALSCGTPIICTENSGAADLIEEGISGWILPPGDLDALEHRLQWCMRNRAQLRNMRVAARRVAEQFTWSQFRQNLRNSIN